jgi:hypothetical protein
VRIFVYKLNGKWEDQPTQTNWLGASKNVYYFVSLMLNNKKIITFEFEPWMDVN